MSLEPGQTPTVGPGRVNGATDIVTVPNHADAGVRLFRAQRRVGLGDVSPAGRCRLDAITAYQQDIATADYESADIGDAFAFVLRRNYLRIAQWPVIGEHLDLVTFCGGTGARWAERQTRMEGDRGALVEAAAVWVAISADGRPIALPPKFIEVFGPTASGRQVTARLSLPQPSVAASIDWTVRRTDLDTLGHVNNTAHWKATEEAFVEDEFGVVATRSGPVFAEIEYHAGLGYGTATQCLVERSGNALSVWLCEGDPGTVRSAAHLTRSA
jgi:acyl-ACP thioesterase